MREKRQTATTRWHRDGSMAWGEIGRLAERAREAEALAREERSRAGVIVWGAVGWGVALLIAAVLGWLYGCAV